MPSYNVTLPPSCWPDDLRARFEKHPLSEAQKRRLGYALGRWLKICVDLGVSPRDVTQETWKERTQGLPRNLQNDVRQALAVAFPKAAISLYASQQERRTRADPRAQLGFAIARNLARFPEDWRLAAAPLLHICDDGLGDGILVQAWAPSTIKRCIEAAAQHFDYCRARGFAVDITPDTIRAKIREDQKSVAENARRIGGVAIHIRALTGLATAVRPERRWAWLKTANERMKKLSGRHGSRSAGRAVDAAELRAAGQQLLAKADAAYAAARHRRDFVKAHTRARTALTMIMLAEAPIRITNCAKLELGSTLLLDLSGLFLDAASTKESDRDRREFSSTLIDALGRYIRSHRAATASPGETRLFVGERGGPITAAQLSKCLGDFTETPFKVRVTPHVIRHSVGNFIVATAPEEAALASIILNHRTGGVTPTYTQRGDQIIASRRLRAASEKCAADLGVDTSPTRNRRKKPANARSVRQPRRAITRVSGARPAPSPVDDEPPALQL